MEFRMHVYKTHAAVEKYLGHDTLVEIPERWEGVPVTEIMANAFTDNKDINEVLMPKTVEVIGAGAFSGCRNLEYAGFRIFHSDDWDEMDSPGKDPRQNFSRMPEALRLIESRAFAGSGIRSVSFSSRDLEIREQAFEGCKRLRHILLLQTRSLKLGEHAFQDSGITLFLAPGADMEMVGDYAFAGCRMLKGAVIHTTAVGERSFWNCENLQDLRVTPGLIQVGREAFAGCGKLENLLGTGKGGRKPPARRKKEQEQIASAAEEKEEPEMSREERIPISEETMGGALLVMTPEGGKHFEGEVFTGIWTRRSGRYCFAVRGLTQEPVMLKSVSRQMPSGIQPLVDYCVANKKEIRMRGFWQDGVYLVADMELAQDEQDLFEPLSPGLFREMLFRLRTTSPEDVDRGKENRPYSMRSEREYELFLELCGDRIPLWVRNAYYKNAEIIKKHNGKNSEDEVKHARRAQELLMNIDWSGALPPVPTVEEARKILDESFYGLEEVKTRILEVVARIRRTGTLPKWGILLTGPAGTGKTSIAKAIARLLSLGMIQMDMSTLGSEPDEISGSSRIYSNARPGMLLESMFAIRSSAALLLANEVDKTESGKEGASRADILLTILDKTGFRENYLEEIVPTDNLFCIGTCNNLEAISKPLRDRFLVIHVPAYTAEEKKVIFRDYIFPRAMASASIPAGALEVTEETVSLLAQRYALEPGARDLEQYAEGIVGRFCALSDAGNLPAGKLCFTAEDVVEHFGPRHAIVHSFAIHPGEVNAVFCHEGRAKFFMVQASVNPGSGQFEVLGPVTKMQENYAKAAYLCVKNTTAINLSKVDVTIFIPHSLPEGSRNYLGFACYAAICSKLLNSDMPVREICLLGGCDMNGSLYFDDNDLTPILRLMKERGLTTLYAPMGTNRLIDPKVNSECGITVVEGPDARTLFALAVTRGDMAS